MLGVERTAMISKLPKRVQNEIASLERKIAGLEAHVRELTTVHPADSNATLHPYSEHSIALPANPTIRHLLSDGQGYLETKFDGRTLNVRGVSTSTFDDFLIVPALRNEIVIEFRRDVR
jgi:hypothetical protein